MAKSKKPAVLVCGLVGAGKSVLCEKLSEYFKLRYCPTGGVLRSIMERELKKNHIAATKNTGFWESEEARRFMQERLKDPKFDKELDDELFGLIEKGGVVLDSWVMPWLSKKGFKIWLTASDDIRFERVAKRDNKGFEEAKESVRIKEAKTTEIYKKIYGFEWGKNLEVFDLIIDTDKLTEQEVFKIAREAIEKYEKGEK